MSRGQRMFRDKKCENKVTILHVLTIIVINLAPTFYLVYFMIDQTVSVIHGNAVIEEISKREVGSLCHVKEKSEGKIITYGIIAVSMCISS